MLGSVLNGDRAMLKVLDILMEKAGVKRAQGAKTRRVARQEIERLFQDDFAAHALIVKQCKAQAAAAKAA